MDCLSAGIQAGTHARGVEWEDGTRTYLVREGGSESGVQPALPQ